MSGKVSRASSWGDRKSSFQVLQAYFYSREVVVNISDSVVYAAGGEAVVELLEQASGVGRTLLGKAIVELLGGLGPRRHFCWCLRAGIHD